MAIAGGATHTPYMLRTRMSLWWSEIDWWGGRGAFRVWRTKHKKGKSRKVGFAGNYALTNVRVYFLRIFLNFAASVAT